MIQFKNLETLIDKIQLVMMAIIEFQCGGKSVLVASLGRFWPFRDPTERKKNLCYQNFNFFPSRELLIQQFVEKVEPVSSEA